MRNFFVCLICLSTHIHFFLFFFCSHIWRSLRRIFFLSVHSLFLSPPIMSLSFQFSFSSFFTHKCWYKHFPFFVHKVRSSFFSSAEWKLSDAAISLSLFIRLTSFRVDPLSQAPVWNNTQMAGFVSLAIHLAVWTLLLIFTPSSIVVQKNL